MSELKNRSRSRQRERQYKHNLLQSQIQALQGELTQLHAEAEESATEDGEREKTFASNQKRMGVQRYADS